MKGKIPHGYLINAENVPGNIEYPFMIAFHKLEMGGVHSNIKAIHVKTSTKIIQ